MSIILAANSRPVSFSTQRRTVELIPLILVTVICLVFSFAIKNVMVDRKNIIVELISINENRKKLPVLSSNHHYFNRKKNWYMLGIEPETFEFEMENRTHCAIN